MESYVTTICNPLLLSFEGTRSRIGAEVNVTMLTASEATSPVVLTQNGRFAKYPSNHQFIALGFGRYGRDCSIIGGSLTDAPRGGSGCVRRWACLSMPAVDAAISDVVVTKYRGGALSLRNSRMFLERATGPVLFAGIAATTGYKHCSSTGGVVTLVSEGVAILVSDSRGHPIGTPEEAA